MPELSTLGDVIHEAQAPFDSWKGTARVATTTIIVRTGLITVDGIALVTGDVVLDQHAAVSSDRGFYIASAGAWARASNALAGSNLDGAVVRVLEGTINGDKTFAQNASPCVVDVDAQTWLEQAGGGSGEHSYTDQVIGVGESRTVVDGQQMLWSGVLTILGTLTLLGTGNATDVTPVVVPAPPVVQPYPSKIVVVSASQAVQFGYLYSINDSGVVLTIPSGAQDGDMFAISNASTGASLVASGGTTIVDAYQSSPASSIALEEVATGDTGQRLFIDIFVYSALPNVWAVLSRTNYPAGPLGALPIVSYGGGGTLNALPGVCYRITADCTVILPPSTGILNARIAVIKDYAGAGPEIVCSGGDVFTVLGENFTSRQIPGAPSGSHLEFQSSIPGAWRTISYFAPASHIGNRGLNFAVEMQGVAPTTGQVLKATSPTVATWQNEVASLPWGTLLSASEPLVVGVMNPISSSGTHALPSSPSDGDVVGMQSVDTGGLAQIVFSTSHTVRGAGLNLVGAATHNIPVATGGVAFVLKFRSSDGVWYILQGAEIFALAKTGGGGTGSLWLKNGVGYVTPTATPTNSVLACPNGGGLQPLSADPLATSRNGRALVSLPVTGLGFVGPAESYLDGRLAELVSAVRARNDDSAVLEFGQAVYISANPGGGFVNVKRAKADSVATARMFGLVGQGYFNVGGQIPIATEGWVRREGVAGIPAIYRDEAVWSLEDRIYLSPTTAGNLTNVRPTASGHCIVPVGRNMFISGVGLDTYIYLEREELEELL
jgi:hypothetical protein